MIHCLLVELRPADHVVVVGRLGQWQVVVVSALVRQVGRQILESTLLVVWVIFTVLLVNIEYFNPISIELTLPKTLFTSPILDNSPQSVKPLSPMVSLLIVIVKISLHLPLHRSQIVSLNHLLYHWLVPIPSPVVVNMGGNRLSWLRGILNQRHMGRCPLGFQLKRCNKRRYTGTPRCSQ